MTHMEFVNKVMEMLGQLEAPSPPTAPEPKFQKGDIVRRIRANGGEWPIVGAIGMVLDAAQHRVEVEFFPPSQTRATWNSDSTWIELVGRPRQ